MSDLVERVARGLYDAEGGTKWDILGEGKKDDYRYLAKTATTIALEEAAKVAEQRYMGDNNREDMEARRIADAIRGMVKEYKNGPA
jgi:hypothetical protein